MRLRLTLLGGFQASLAPAPAIAVPRRRAQGLLAYLGVHLGQPQPRDKLGTLLWPETDDQRSRQSLRQILTFLRGRLGEAAPALLRLEREGVALDPAAVDVDVARFEGLVAAGSMADLERAADLYGGDLLEGLRPISEPFEEWLMAERERLRELAIDAMSRLLDDQRRSEEHGRIVRTAGRLLTLDPLQEVVHCALMDAYAALGRRGSALRQYQICVDVLQRELGAQPDARTRATPPYPSRRLEPPRVCRVLAERAAAAGASPFSALRSGDVAARAAGPPLVGRGAELAVIARARQDAAGGRGRLVVIHGEAGVGKTQLIRTAIDEWGPQRGRFLRSGCVESERLFPLAPWVEALRSGDPAVASAVPSLAHPWQAELRRLRPEIGGPEAPPLAEPSLERRLFEAVTQLLAQLSRTDPPLVLVMEDLHWADVATVRMLSFVARRSIDWPLLIMATVRDEDVDRALEVRTAFDIIERERPVTRLRLTPLSRAESTLLTRALCGGTTVDEPERLADQTWAVSEGNPFVIVETVRAAVDGTLARGGALALAPRVEELIRRRFDALGETARTLLSVMAVIGREAEFAVIHHASQLSEPEAASGVEELVRRQMARAEGERFAFSHDRVREVARRLILAPRLKLLHARVGEALARVHAANLEPHYEALGLHYRAGEVWDRAAAYLARAGNKARLRSAHREAVAALEGALEAVRRLPETPATLAQAVDLCLELRISLWLLAELERLHAHLRAAEEWARALGDRGRLCRVTLYRGHYLWLAGDFAHARALIEDARVAAGAIAHRPLQLWANLFAAQVCLAQGDHRRADALLRENLRAEQAATSRDSACPRVLSQALLAVSTAEGGDFAEGLALGRDAVHQAERLDHPDTLAGACWRLAHLLCLKGDVDEAIQLLERARAICHEWELAFQSSMIQRSLGYAYSLAGRASEGLPLQRQALGGPVQGNGLQALRLIHLAQSCVAGDQIEEALESAEHGLALAMQHEQRGHEAWARCLLGEIAARRAPDDPATAEGHYRQALALAADLGMRPLVARCHFGLGQIPPAAGTPERRDHLATARAMFREMDMRLELASKEG